MSVGLGSSKSLPMGRPAFSSPGGGLQRELKKVPGAGDLRSYLIQLSYSNLKKLRPRTKVEIDKKINFIITSNHRISSKWF